MLEMEKNSNPNRKSTERNGRQVDERLVNAVVGSTYDCKSTVQYGNLEQQKKQEALWCESWYIDIHTYRFIM